MIQKDPAGDNYYSGDDGDLLNWDFNRVMEEEERLDLLKTLNKEGLCTRDVMSFIINQADLRTSIKTPDKKTTRSAMFSKIMDSKESLKWKQKK